MPHTCNPIASLRPTDVWARAVSWVMVDGLIAAVIGPRIVIATRDAILGVQFAGSFISQAVLASLVFFVLTRLRTNTNTVTEPVTTAEGGRTVPQLLVSPKFLLGVAAGVVSYGLMSFVMTAAPLAMVGCGHSIDHAAWGIQWRVLAMFAPSLVTGNLIDRFGKEMVTAAGLIIIGVSDAIALTGLDLRQFFISLILLGIGWNFGFISATAMIAGIHIEEERGEPKG